VVEEDGVDGGAAEGGERRLAAAGLVELVAARLQEVAEPEADAGLVVDDE
jgi:hypothetical protein